MTKHLITDQQRRARLVARHHLAGDATSIDQAVRDLVVLHSSDPVTPFLSLRARVQGFAVADLEAALYEQRSLWRLHAMRRTLFIVSADEAQMLEAAAGRKVAAAERKRVDGWLTQFLAEEEIEGWLAEVREALRLALRGGKTLGTSELTFAVQQLDRKITLGKGKWAQESSIASRVLYLLAMESELVRGPAKGTWRGSQYQWARADNWFGDRLELLVPFEDQAAARAQLANRYLARFGPVMRDDLKWFTGWTVPETMEALAANAAVEVDLHRKETAWVLPDDVEDVPEEETGLVTFLPGLDPTPMAYKERRFMVGRHHKVTFDDTGNIGPTVWLDGKVVGGWITNDTGQVIVDLLEDIGEDAVANVVAETERLTAWLDGTPLMSRFPSHLEKELRDSLVD